MLFTLTKMKIIMQFFYVWHEGHWEGKKSILIGYGVSYESTYFFV